MGLPYIPQSPNEKDSPRLSSLNFISGAESGAEQRRNGFAGFIGSLMLFMAFFAMAWASLDRTVDIRSVMSISFIFLGGFALSLGFGFQLSKRTDIKSEMNSIMLGVSTGILVLVIQIVLMSIGINFASNDNVAFALLAPVAETMAFVVAPYHLFSYNFPEAHWTTMAIPADLVFSIFHFYRYASHPYVILIWVILVIGNTLFVYIYHITRNATAPILAHFIVNLAANTQPVTEFMIAYLPLFIGMFIVFAFLYWFIGGIRK